MSEERTGNLNEHCAHDPKPALEFGRVTDFARRLLGVTHASVYLGDGCRGMLDLGDPSAVGDSGYDGIALARSVCAQNRPTPIADLRNVATQSGAYAREPSSAGAYLGVPIRLAEGEAVGTLSVFATGPREWDAAEITVLEDLAGLAAEELRLHLDIAARERAQSDLLLVVRELEHRARNAFSIVQAVISLSMRDKSLLPLKLEIIDRISTVSATQELIAGHGDGIVDLGEILERELAALTSGKLRRMQGPAIPIVANEAVFVGMIVHELTTNAVKHGALRANIDGDLAVDWRRFVRDGRQVVSLCWRETWGGSAGENAGDGGPGTGFGSELLEILVVNQLRGSLERAYVADGLEITLELVLTQPELNRRPRDAA